MTLKSGFAQKCRNLPGSAILNMLSSILNLEFFPAGAIDEDELLKDARPWVCVGLKDLYLTCKCSGRQDATSGRRLYLTRISELKRL
jgi:hypothetical protein